MTRFISFALLTCFGISLVLLPAVEATHEVMHQIENRFHEHAHSHSHTIADHHIRHSHDTPDSEETDNGLNYVSFLFIFFHAGNGICVMRAPHWQGFSDVISFYQSLNPCPPFSPPLS